MPETPAGAIKVILDRFPSDELLDAVDDNERTGKRPAPMNRFVTIAEMRAARAELEFLNSVNAVPAGEQEDSVLSDDDWQVIQNETGSDIIDIVMNVVNNRVSSGQTMDRVFAQCEAAFRRGLSRNTSVSPQPALNSDVLATLIFNYCAEVKFGCGKESLWQRDIQQIVDEWITDSKPSVSPSEEEIAREVIERVAQVLCDWCGEEGYSLVFHHNEWRHYRTSDQHVEYCRAHLIRCLPLTTARASSQPAELETKQKV